MPSKAYRPSSRNRDKQTRNYVRAQYKVDPVTKELNTDPKTKALELVLVRNTPPRN